MKHKKRPLSEKLREFENDKKQDIETLKQYLDFFVENGVGLSRGEKFSIDHLPDKLKLSPEINLKAPLSFAKADEPEETIKDRSTSENITLQKLKNKHKTQNIK